jgi:hypothetical protein
MAAPRGHPRDALPLLGSGIICRGEAGVGEAGNGREVEAFGRPFAAEETEQDGASQITTPGEGLRAVGKRLLVDEGVTEGMAALRNWGSGGSERMRKLPETMRLATKGRDGTTLCADRGLAAFVPGPMEYGRREPPH